MKTWQKIIACLLAAVVFCFIVTMTMHKAATTPDPITIPVTYQYEVANSDVTIDPNTIPEGLEIENLVWIGKPSYPYHEYRYEPKAELIRQVETYVKSNPKGSFTIKSKRGNSFINYDANSHTITLDSNCDYLSFEAYYVLRNETCIYKVGQPTLPNWKGKFPDRRWEKMVLKSFEDKTEVWNKVSDGDYETWCAWTDDLKHQLVVSKFAFTGRNPDPILYIDEGCRLSVAAQSRVTDTNPTYLTELYNEGLWDGQVVRNGADFAKMDENGNIVYRRLEELDNDNWRIYDYKSTTVVDGVYYEDISGCAKWYFGIYYYPERDWDNWSPVPY